MLKLIVRSLLLPALLAAPLAAKQPEKQPEPPASSRDTQDVRYEIRFMDLHAAEVLAWDQCAQKERCRVASLTVPGEKRKYLEVRAEPAVQEKIARALAREDRQPRTHGFQILLLAANLKPGSGGQ